MNAIVGVQPPLDQWSRPWHQLQGNMMEDNTYDSAGWSVTLKGPEAGRFSFAFSHTMARAWLGAIVRAVGTEREKEGAER